MILSILCFIAGILLVIFGADWLTDGASALARRLKMSELMIGLTIVAIGTSLPELAASLIATKRGETDIAVGNIVGSNIWNILCIMGVSPLVRPIQLENISLLDMGAMLIISLLAIPFMYIGKNVTRIAGVIWFLCYIAYLVLLIVK